jgi:predicted small lipoprotein YifL
MARLMRWAIAAVLLILTFTACGPKADDAKVVAITKPSAEAPFDRTFTWKPVNGATQYHIVVFTRAFEVRDLTTAGVKLSDSVQLPPGTYSVQVTALRDGQTVAQSTRTAFDIR